MKDSITSFGANTPGSNPDTLRRWAKLNAPDLPQTALRLEEAADEIERLRSAVKAAIVYCYKFEREHEAGHPGMGALMPIQQDLQSVIGL